MGDKIESRRRLRGEFLKEGESTYWLKAGSFQTGRHGVSEEDWSSGILNIKNI